MLPIGTIFDKHGTDKNKFHGYGPTYDQLFPWSRRPLITSVLEFGVDRGASLESWAEIFPNAMVVGVDLLMQYKSFSDRISTIEGNLLDACVADKIRLCGLFDLIIDDASHHMDEQICALNMYFDQLKTGGLYIIEEFAWYEYGRRFGEKRGQMVVRVK